MWEGGRRDQKIPDCARRAGDPLSQADDANLSTPLVQISGNLWTLLEFLPGRQTITRVQWNPYFDDIDDGKFVLLSAEWERITHFSIRGFMFRPKLSPIVNGVFSSLVALELYDLYYVRGQAYLWLISE